MTYRDVVRWVVTGTAAGVAGGVVAGLVGGIIVTTKPDTLVTYQKLLRMPKKKEEDRD